MKIDFSESRSSKAGAIVIGVPEGNRLGPAAASLDKEGGGLIRRAIKSGHFEGKRKQALKIVAPQNVPANQIVLIGLGDAKGLSETECQNLGGEIAGQVNAAKERHGVVLVDRPTGCRLRAPEIAASIAYGAYLSSYRFDKYRKKKNTNGKPSLEQLSLQVKGAAQARRRYEPLAEIAEGVFFTRDLVSEPANVIYPETLAREALKLRRLGVRVEVLDEADMRKLGMGALLGVAQGSVRKPRLVVLRWQGATKRAKDKAPVAFVGKGVTFDSGGISIKPSAHMEDMKWDMGGSAVVLGVLRALAARKARVNAVGVIGLVENMPSGTAQRPGDVVTSMSGQTVEVINTDAEGRLVLADALWYCQNRFKPKVIVDLATLTGAIIVALGAEFAGLFSTDDKLAAKLAKAGEQEGERLWRMPLDDAYDKDIDSDIADMKNVGSGRGAGSSTAAQFVKRYIQDIPWAHIDIAGVTWSNRKKPTVPKGGTGFGVRLLNRFVADNYEGR
ncbi:MAG: leucyl aminopeptidase [Alphaproteobacteria bacterium]|nr:leucyl aminopeptidase [Alphaproteobacteria bacterium]